MPHSRLLDGVYYPHWGYPHEDIKWCFDLPTQPAAIIPHEEKCLHGFMASRTLLSFRTVTMQIRTCRCLQTQPGGADDHITGRPLKTQL